MDNKTLSIVSYITVIGWLISYFSSKDNLSKSSLVIYHQKQSLGLAVVGIAYGLISRILIMFVPAIGIIFSLVSLLLFVLMIIGIVNAANEVQKPLPIIGKTFEDKFSFIK
ncbi:DUF4870 domain-containing protein [Flavobacterium ardleyense]|uniref:DUF4870 domain-containing protein n=1 Tax=Flavobacterium ardleyense TaxID=2038737 RepID=A0ABW5Z8F0_9FLAO